MSHSSPTNFMRSLAAATALSMSFAPLAQANPLLADVAVSNRYRVQVTDLVTKSVLAKLPAGTSKAEINKIEGDSIDFSGGFIGTLEKDYLKQPSDAVRAFLYPIQNSVNMLVIGAVVPAKDQMTLPIITCAQQNNSVVAIGAINQTTGHVTTVKWDGPTTGEVTPAGVKPACGAVLGFYRTQYRTLLAQMTPAPAAPATTTSAAPATDVVVAQRSVAAQPARP
jgi:hypothetical protein